MFPNSVTYGAFTYMGQDRIGGHRYYYLGAKHIYAQVISALSTQSCVTDRRITVMDKLVTSV